MLPSERGEKGGQGGSRGAGGSGGGLSHLTTSMLVRSRAGGGSWGWGGGPMRTRHPDCHMGWIIGGDVNGDLGRWGQAGGHGGAG